MYRRRSLNINENNVIIYTGTSKIEPNVTSGWGSTYNSGKSTYDSSTGIGKIYFDGKITNIPSDAFRNNNILSKLTSITYIPSTVNTINSNAFRFNESGTSLRCQLKTIKLNEGLLYINSRAFLSNRYLTEVVLPNSLQTVGDYCFNGCMNIKSITVGENFKKFVNSGDTSINNGTGIFWGSPCKTVIWNAIDCRDFTLSKHSPFTSESINKTTNPLNHNDNPIKNVYFGDKVKHIPACLFWKCPNISNDIVIPASCERIGDRAFQACTGISNVFVYAETPPLITPTEYETNPNYEFPSTTNGVKIGNVVFKQFINNAWQILPNLTIYVPSTAYNSYINDTNWKVYASVIKPFRTEYKGIDLGLRTSEGKKILFADRNILAGDEYSPGAYFSWGDYAEHFIPNNGEDFQSFNDGHIFDSTTYKYSNDTYTSLTKYNTTDNKTVLEGVDDAAKYHLGGTWRIPTSSEFSLLLDESKFDKIIIDIDGQEFIEGSGKKIKGIKFVSKIPGFVGRSIFFGAFGAGNGELAQHINTTVSFWCSDLSSNKSLAKFLYLYIDPNTKVYTIKVSETNRYYGRQIRAVKIE
jgi:hypothetical protein